MNRLEAELRNLSHAENTLKLGLPIAAETKINRPRRGLFELPNRTCNGGIIPLQFG